MTKLKYSHNTRTTKASKISFSRKALRRFHEERERNEVVIVESEKV